MESSGWHDGDSANICIGQGEMAVTPMQMAVAYSAIANGGTVFWPRLVEQIEPQDPASGEAATNFPAGLVRDQLDVSARSLKILRDAMLAETWKREGTGTRRASARPADLRQDRHGAGEDAQNQSIGRNYWFASFAPYENPQYAVVVMVENGSTVRRHRLARRSRTTFTRKF